MRLSKTAATVGATLTLLLRAADSGDLSLDQWRHDLQFFASELPKRHGNAYHHATREQFEAAVADLNGRLPGMDYDQAATGFMRLAAMVGDAHTSVQFPAGSGRIFPLVLREFDGQFRVIAVGPGFEKALGARLLRIGDTPVEQACQLLSSLGPQDEHPWLRRALAANDLISSRLLHGVGIIADDRSARYAFVGDDGQEFTLT